MSTLLSVQGLKKSFGSRVLFETIQFSLNDGERVGLIGPNGSGKSTLLSILAGSNTSDEGEVIAKKGVRIAFLEQVPQFDPQKSILDTILEKAGEDSDQMHRALEAFSRVGLDNLGSPPETLMKPLSGGWQKRVALARELAMQPDLLLLDEPTNHLDVEAILWLESFLKRAPFAVVTVTHDRAFLQSTSNRILELDRKNPNGLLSVNGSYTEYLERKTQLLESQKAKEASMKNRLRRETEWLRQGAKARSTKQKARIQRAETLRGDLDELAAKNRSQSIQMQFDERGKKPKRLIEGQGLGISFGNQNIFEGLDVFLGPGTRLGLIGPNGSGKTTLIRVLVGELAADQGTLQRAEDLQVAYFQQHRDSLDPQKSLLKSICPSGDHVNYQGRSYHVRSYLDRFLFSPEQADQPVSKLSGGEQARLLIAKLMLTPADVLILDEPTNDLDISTLDVLEQCLLEFQGAVILVSHDRYFLDRVSNMLLAFDSGGITAYADLAQWEYAKTLQKDSAKPTPKNTIKAPKRKKKLSYKEEKELEGMEEKIHQAEVRLAALTKETQLPENLSSSIKLQELYKNISETQNEIDSLFERWQELESLKKELASQNS